ncbi:MAG: zinc ABC transporter substrate-binding protein [Syntrophobacterales bacterium]|nr:zinc ABC transporter substrate-binding protein [Syntrophobacterales bacterium]
MYRILMLFLFFSLFCLFEGLSVASSTGEPEGPSVVVGVTIPPQKFFVEQIGGKRVQVVTMIPQGVDPHTYEPKPKDIEALKEAKAYLSLGEIEVEKIWLSRLKKLFPNMKIVNTSSDVAFLQSDHYHAGEVKEEHRGAGKDPHVWLSPPLVMLQSRVIYKTLIEIDPEGRSLYDEGFRNWMSRLTNLDMELMSIFSPFKGKAFIIYHPAWAYFSEAYGIKQFAVEKEGKPPGPKDLKQLKNIVSQNNIRILFVTSETPQVSAKNIAEQLGLTLDLLNPLAYDWETNILTVTKKLVSSWTFHK